MEDGVSTMKRILIALTAVILLAGAGAAYGHGNPGLLVFADLEKTGARTFTMSGSRSGSVSHNEVHINACLWHRNANGWHVHGNSCVHKHVDNASGFSIRVGVTVSCPETDGPVRTRIKTWDVGDAGTVHNTVFDNSDTPYPSVNC